MNTPTIPRTHVWAYTFYDPKRGSSFKATTVDGTDHQAAIAVIRNADPDEVYAAFRVRTWTEGRKGLNEFWLDGHGQEINEPRRWAA